MKRIFIFFYVFIFKFIFTESACSSHCEKCSLPTICTQCETSYKLIGIKQNDAGNEITCTNEDLSTGYFITEANVHYPCTNDDYIYLDGNEDTCYRKIIGGIKNYYTNDEGRKYYYSCSAGTYAIPNCHECTFIESDDPGTSSVLNCEKCLPSYTLIYNDFSLCHSIISLGDEYYKVNQYTYASCSVILNCIRCRSSSECIQCNTNYYIVNTNKKKCEHINDITPIDEYYLEDYTYYSCSYGVRNCKKCSSKDTCTECLEGYSLVDGNHSLCIEQSKIIPTQLYYTLDTGKNYYSCQNIPDKNCLKCELTDGSNPSNLIINCIKCLNSYVYLDNDKGQCHSETSLANSNYYKVDRNNYESCGYSMDKCVTCEKRNHCLTCVSNYGVLDEDFTQCQQINTQLAAQTIYMKNNLYYSCSIIEGCVKCTAEDQCIETTSSEYCVLNGIPIKLKEINDLFFSSSDYQCKPCNETINYCKLCTASNNCYQCKEGYTMINNVRSSCVNSGGYSIGGEYFTIDNGINYYGCGEILINGKAIENCQKCEYDNILKKNNCILCANNYIILDEDGSICISTSTFSSQITQQTMFSNNEGTKYYSCNKVMQNCDKCNSDHNCLACKEGYIFLNNDKSKCLNKNDYNKGHYYSNDDINYYSCLANCLQCTNSAVCIKCDDGYELNDFKDKCEKILYNENDIKQNCIYITKPIDETIYDIDKAINDLIEDIVTNEKSGLLRDKNKLVKFINGKYNYSIILFKNELCTLYLYEDNFLNINTSEILTELKKYTTTKDIIQGIISYKNQTAVTFFESDGIHIDIKNLCPACLQKKYNVTYNYKEKLLNDIGEKLTEIIGEKDIDVFNENSEFFQNFCQNLQIEGIDIPLNKRKYLLYQGNSSYNANDTSKGDLYACNVNCTLISNSPSNFSSICACDLNYDIEHFKQFADDKENEIKEVKYNKSKIDDDYNFLNNSKDTFDMFTCSNYAFTGENIKKNPGFYVVVLSFTSQIVGLAALLLKLKINSFAKLLIIANPPPLKQKNKTEEQKNNNNVNDNTNNQKRVVKRVTDYDYYLTYVDDDKNNNNNNNNNNVITTNDNNVPPSQKRLNEEEENNYEPNGEIHHQRLNIFNNNYVTPGSIKIGHNKKKDRKDNSSNSDTNNNDEDIFREEKNSEMDYYPVIKYIEYDVNVYRDIGYSYEQKDIKELRKKYEGVKMIQYNLLNKNEKTKLLPLIYKSLLKDHLPYKYGVYYDKRNFCTFYFYLLCLRNPVINLFINSNNNSQNFIPFSVKSIKIIFTGIMMLFFNALFINQKYIYNKYNFFDEKYNFQKLSINDKISFSEKLKYSIKNSIINGILAYIIIMVLDSFLNWLFSIRRRIKNLLDDYYEIESGKNSNVSRYNRERKNFEKELLEVSDLKCLYIVFTVFFYVFMIIFFIYLVNFCSTYKGVVNDLFLAGLWTFILYFLMPMLSTLIISGIRYLGLKAKIKCFYNLSRILMEM